MVRARVPDDEFDRLAALRDAAILDTPAEPRFDGVVRLAAKICAVPIALVSLVDGERQWFKARVGLGASETPRDVAFCAHAILGRDAMVVEDSSLDDRFADNPLVTGEPHVAFYAGVPLVTHDDHALGTLCVIDHEPRQLTPDQLDALRVLAGQVTDQIELRRRVRGHEAIAAELDGFFSLSLDLLCVADTNGSFTRLNPAWESTLGYSRAELLGRPYLDFVHPDDRKATIAQTTKLAEGDLTVDFEHRFRTRTGDYRRLRWAAAPSADRKSLFAAARDVTEMHDALASVRRAERRLRDALAAAVDGIVTIDERGRIESVNPAVERLFGYTADELVGRNVSVLMPEPYRSEHDGYLAAYLGGREPRVIGVGRDVVGRRKDGTTFPVYLAVGEIGGGERREFIGILCDATERHDARARLERQAKALVRASARASAANRLKSEFLSSMSHELRTPLNGILGFSRLLHDGEAGPVNDTQTEFLGHVLRSAEHLLQLINDVLDLSKVDAGKLEFHPESVDVEAVIGETCAVVRELAAKKRIRISVDVAPSIGRLLLDPARLKQVLYNFLSNAIKFTPERGSIHVRVRPAPADRVRFEVEDTGIGVAEHDLPKLFNEFQQVGSAASGAEGTGLGLALTKRLVERQGGEVGVRSALDEGSTFFAVLPRRHEIEEPREAAVDPHEPESGEVIEPEMGRILVVEDDARERAWLRRTLGQAGFVVDAVATGAEAIRRAESRLYAAITLDLFLPDMMGSEALEAIRRGKNSATPTIIVTVVDDPSLAIGASAQAIVLKGAGASQRLLDELLIQLGRPS